MKGSALMRHGGHDKTCFPNAISIEFVTVRPEPISDLTSRHFIATQAPVGSVKVDSGSIKSLCCVYPDGVPPVVVDRDVLTTA
jgi:hypothetical protein